MEMVPKFLMSAPLCYVPERKVRASPPEGMSSEGGESDRLAAAVAGWPAANAVGRVLVGVGLPPAVLETRKGTSKAGPLYGAPGRSPVGDPCVNMSTPCWNNRLSTTYQSSSRAQGAVAMQWIPVRCARARRASRACRHRGRRLLLALLQAVAVGKVLEATLDGGVEEVLLALTSPPSLVDEFLYMLSCM